MLRISGAVVLVVGAVFWIFEGVGRAVAGDWIAGAGFGALGCMILGNACEFIGAALVERRQRC